MGLLFSVLVLAIAFGAFRSASQIWARAIFTMTLGILFFGILGAAFRKGEARVWWAGFALSGWAYLVLAFGPWSNDHVRPHLSTTDLFANLGGAVHWMKGSGPSSDELKLQTKLQQPVTLQFVSTPLSDVIDFLRDYTQVNLVIDHPALEAAGIDPNPPVTFHVEQITGKSAIKLLLRQVGLAYTVRDDVILITTAGHAGLATEDEYIQQIGHSLFALLVGLLGGMSSYCLRPRQREQARGQGSEDHRVGSDEPGPSQKRRKILIGTVGVLVIATLALSGWRLTPMIGDYWAVRKIVGGIKHGQYDAVEEGIHALKSRGTGENAIPAIVECLQAEDASVRLMAAWALFHLGPDAMQATLPLALATQDEYPDVRRKATETLGWLGPQTNRAVRSWVLAMKEEAVTAILLEALKDPDASVRSFACVELGKVCSEAEAVVQQIICGLKDESPEVRVHAARALQNMAGRGNSSLWQATHWLIEASFDENEDVRRAARDALEQINPSIAGELRGVTGRLPGN